MTDLVVALDLGTTNVKGSIFSIEGEVVGDAYREVKLIYPRSGWVEQNSEELYDSSLFVLREAIKTSKQSGSDVRAIALGGQMAGLILIDRNWKPLTPFESWLDIRCKEYVGNIKKEYGELVWNKTGMPLHTHSTLPKLLWWKNHKPNIFRKARKALLASDFVAGKMAGLTSDDAFINYTSIVFSGCHDALKLTWSEEILNLFDIPMSVFPKIVRPWDIIGELSAQSAKRCGIPPGTPIIAGAGDQAAASLGAGIIEPGMAFDSSGTAAIFSVCIDQFVPDTKHKILECLKSIVPDLWLLLGAVSGGGLCLRWFRDTLTNNAMKKRGEPSTYAQLDERAEKVPPGSEKLFFIPHFAGRRNPLDSNMKGGWIGLTWSHTVAHLYRSILESIAYEYYFYLKLLKNLLHGFKCREVRVVGGGGKSMLWNQIKSDVLGVPYIKLSHEEDAALGLAVVAGFGIGLLKDIKETVRKWVRPIKIVKPRPDLHIKYTKYAEFYLNFVNSLRDVFENHSKITQ
jgi:xylulokinase